jgi:CheY-like chemotaxis protein
MTSVILLVDPNADTREMYGRLLGAEPDWRVLTASDTAQAADLTRARVPDVVVRELTLREAMCETGVCDTFRRFYGASVPVIAITGVPPQTVRDQSGYACVLQKPLLRDDLILSIRRIMNQRRVRC